jgi:hypothetical protein
MLKKSKYKNVQNIQNRKKKRTVNKKPKKTNRTTTLQKENQRKNKNRKKPTKREQRNLKTRYIHVSGPRPMTARRGCEAFQCGAGENYRYSAGSWVVSDGVECMVRLSHVGSIWTRSGLLVATCISGWASPCGASLGLVVWVQCYMLSSKGMWKLI